MSTGRQRDVAIVVPVHNGEDDVVDCLASITEHAPGSSVIVVDDASSDATAAVARAAGAEVITLARRAGPYAARNAGWESTTADVVVFTDVRNRARTGWLDALLEPLADPGVAIVGGVVSIGGDNRLAHRLARRQSHVDPRPLLDDTFLPFVTTSSMAVRRAALDAVGGFETRRSGADAELCWRVQLETGGEIAVARGSQMTMMPRSSVVDIWRQWWRYAGAYVELRRRFAREGALVRQPLSRQQVVDRLREAGGRLRRPGRDPLLELADVVRWLGYEVAYRRAVRRGRQADE